jgi:hypothetical protein
MIRTFHCALVILTQFLPRFLFGAEDTNVGKRRTVDGRFQGRS